MERPMEFNTAEYSYADFTRRFFALVIDSFFIGMGIYILVRLGIIRPQTEAMSIMLQDFLYYNEVPNSQQIQWAGSRVLLAKLILTIYKSAFESSLFQATPGKMILKLRVVDYGYVKITFLRALLRNIGKGLSAFGFYAGYWITLINRKNQGFHDYLASTYVIMPRPVPVDPVGPLEDDFV